MRVTVLALSFALVSLAGSSIAFAETDGTDDGSDDGTGDGSDDGTDGTDGTDGDDEEETTDTGEVDDGVYGGLGVAAKAGEDGGWSCQSAGGSVLLLGFFGWAAATGRRRD